MHMPAFGAAGRGGGVAKRLVRVVAVSSRVAVRQEYTGDDRGSTTGWWMKIW